MKKVLKYTLIIISVILSIFLLQGYLKYVIAINTTPLEEKVSEIRASEDFTPLSEIPDTFVNAMFSVEDRRFYSHNGFDIIGTGRALITDIKNMELLEGGSTISQQLAKNMYFPLDNSPTRKLSEIFMALTIESTYSKEEILELYFNIIYYGKNCYNIHDAAKTYFNKAPINMTDYECTLLAGIPNAPSVYSKNPKLAAERQRKVLRSMVDSGYISQERMNEILNK